MIIEKYFEHNTLLASFISELQDSLSVKSTCRNMMTWGYSQHWTKTLLQFTGDSRYNTTALLDYFKPLESYLDEYLSNRSITPGWNESECPLAPMLGIRPPPANHRLLRRPLVEHQLLRRLLQHQLLRRPLLANLQ